MKKGLVIVVLLVFVMAMVGCTTVNAPAAAAGATVGTKTGQASGNIILGMFGTVDAGMLRAARNGGITRIATVDVEVKNMFGIITTYTTTVTGE